ncbi:uncharacterized protein LOC141648988 [Silene latifolia]|uniref:uncharacterized protein LOC141648988 n=1 Tax=Silene latifolia TaxID=37657 RepID=UPI003D76F772
MIEQQDALIEALKNVESLLEAVKCPEDMIVDQAVFYLRDEAGVWWQNMREEVQAYYRNRGQPSIPWVGFKSAMREHFVPEHIRHKLRAEFDSFSMAVNMNVIEYYHQFIELSRYMEDMQLSQRISALRFEKGLAPMITDRLPAGVLTDLKEVYVRAGHAKRLVDLAKEAKERNVEKRKAESEGGNQSSHKKGTSDNSNLACLNCGGSGHKRYECTSAGRGGGGFPGTYQGNLSHAPSQSFASNRPAGSWGNR